MMARIEDIFSIDESHADAVHRLARMPARQSQHSLAKRGHQEIAQLVVECADSECPAQLYWGRLSSYVHSVDPCHVHSQSMSLGERVPSPRSGRSETFHQTAFSCRPTATVASAHRREGPSSTWRRPPRVPSRYLSRVDAVPSWPCQPDSSSRSPILQGPNRHVGIPRVYQATAHQSGTKSTARPCRHPSPRTADGLDSRPPESSSGCLRLRRNVRRKCRTRSKVFSNSRRPADAALALR